MSALLRTRRFAIWLGSGLVALAWIALVLILPGAIAGQITAEQPAISRAR